MLVSLFQAMIRYKTIHLLCDRRKRVSLRAVGKILSTSQLLGALPGPAL